MGASLLAQNLAFHAAAGHKGPDLRTALLDMDLAFGTQALDLDAAETALIAALDACPAQITLVSNEVGQGIIPENALARRFREAQGRLNIRMAAHADTVIHVVAGLPNVLKGVMP